MEVISICVTFLPYVLTCIGYDVLAAFAVVCWYYSQLLLR
jgi:hypothetical protein